jgi:hypothetical protein
MASYIILGISFLPHPASKQPTLLLFVLKLTNKFEIDDWSSISVSIQGSVTLIFWSCLARNDSGYNLTSMAKYKLLRFENTTVQNPIWRSKELSVHFSKY